jgi:RNA polymerase sigma-70 factor (ECF subfamily)
MMLMALDSANHWTLDIGEWSGWEWERNLLAAHLRRRGATDGAAEEVTQEVMLAVWRRAPHIDPRRTDTGAWIFALTRDAAVGGGWAGPDPHDPASAGEAEGGGAEAGIVRDALGRLLREQLEVLRRFFYHEETSPGSTVQAPGLPRGEARCRLRLALVGLRAALGVSER